jgi:hypothetical protein
VLEADLFEPSLFVSTDPDAVGNVVAAVQERLAEPHTNAREMQRNSTD